jgi:type I site-specific restriction endonuclease
MHVTSSTETQSETEQPETTAPTPAEPGTRAARKTILAWSIFALGLNATAAVYTLSPADFTLPDVSRVAELIPDVSKLAELLPQQKASDPVVDPVVAALQDIQSTQQRHVASLEENSSSLQHATALLQQDSTTLASLRQTITDEHLDVKKISAQISDEHVDVKKMSAQISTLIAKVDTLQNSIAPEFTSSIAKGHARNRLSGMLHKRIARQARPAGPISVGGAPLTVPATTPAPQT